MLLRVEDLRTEFRRDDGVLTAVDGVSFQMGRGEAAGLVGESGCGKTIVALSLLNLVPPPGRVVGGRVVFDGEDLLRVDRRRLEEVRGAEIGFVFQEPGAALDPVFTVGHQIRETLQTHLEWSRRRAEREAVALLEELGIPEPERRARAYPHELSGGMQQRVMIALAVCTRPRLLIADEPTSALDVTVQADILELLGRLRKRYDMSLLLISHDFPVVAEAVDRLMVMYAGKILEKGPVGDVLNDPAHPYTDALVSSVPRLGENSGEPLRGIPGPAPDPVDRPDGCPFHPRCPIGDEGCTREVPPMRTLGEDRRAACYKLEGSR